MIEIAIEVGFENASHFARLFRKTYRQFDKDQVLAVHPISAMSQQGRPERPVFRARRSDVQVDELSGLIAISLYAIRPPKCSHATQTGPRHQDSQKPRTHQRRLLRSDSRAPVTTIKSSETMSFKSFSTTFANTLPASQMKATYDWHIVPAPGRIYFQAALGLGNGVTFKNPKRPPLLLVAAAEDRTSTPSMVRAMYRRHSRARRRTYMFEFPSRSHWLMAEPGWEEVADRAVQWAQVNATPTTLA